MFWYGVLTNAHKCCPDEGFLSCGPDTTNRTIEMRSSTPQDRQLDDNVCEVDTATCFAYFDLCASNVM